jgi:hypothetical protein
MGGSNKKGFEGMISKKLILDRSAWKMEIHVSEP